MTHDEIVDVLVNYLLKTNPLARKLGQLPLHQSLYEQGILDSFGIVEMVAFIESRWAIEILDSELTKEMFGGIDKMARLVSTKTRSLPQTVL
jgi:acyl carrier protein